MRPESALAAGQWDIPCPVCGGPLEMRATPERISNPQNAYGMSKLGQEMVAINLGRRYGIPTVALRYSIVQGPRQSVYNAYSGACRIFCLSYLQGVAPTLYEDGGAIRDYVNIHDVVDANVLVLQDDRAIGRVFNVGGGAAVTTREFADVVMRQYGSDPARQRSPGSTASATPATSCPTSAPCGRWAGNHAARRPSRSRSTRRGWRRSKAWTAYSPRPTRGCAPWAWSGGRRREGLPPRGRPRHPAEADHQHHPEVHAGHRRPAAARHLARRLRRGGRRRGAG